MSIFFYIGCIIFPAAGMGTLLALKIRELAHPVPEGFLAKFRSKGDPLIEEWRASLRKVFGARERRMVGIFLAEILGEFTRIALRIRRAVSSLARRRAAAFKKRKIQRGGEATSFFIRNILEQKNGGKEGEEK